jgi:hypothetical protein
MLGATAANADTVTFGGTLNDTDKTVVSGTLSFGTFPSDSSSSDALGYFTSDTTEFITWDVTIGSTDFEPAGDFRSDTVYVIDSTTDRVLVISSYKDVDLQLVFSDDDGESFSGDTLPSLMDIDWDTVTIKVYDYSGEDSVTYEGTVTTISNPLPPAVWTGFGLIGICFLRRLRRRR